MSFYKRLNTAWDRSGSMLCVGLDPDVARFPTAMRGSVDAIEEFCKAIVDATGDLVCAFKPQIAYFAAVGAEKQLENICDYIRAKFPDVVLILDAKRGDIGDTAALYAREAFSRYGADAVTVNPYLGTDSLEPFLTTPGKGTIVLCLIAAQANFSRLKLTVSRFIYVWRELRRQSGVRSANALWLLARRTPMSWPKCARSSVICRYLCLVSVLRAETSTPSSAPAPPARALPPPHKPPPPPAPPARALPPPP